MIARPIGTGASLQPIDFSSMFFPPLNPVQSAFLDWRQPGGFIHIGPYVWGKEAADCPGFDFEWQGEQRPKPYGVYADGLDTLAGESEFIFKRRPR